MTTVFNERQIGFDTITCEVMVKDLPSDEEVLGERNQGRRILYEVPAGAVAGRALLRKVGMQAIYSTPMAGFADIVRIHGSEEIDLD